MCGGQLPPILFLQEQLLVDFQLKLLVKISNAVKEGFLNKRNQLKSGIANNLPVIFSFNFFFALLFLILCHDLCFLNKRHQLKSGIANNLPVIFSLNFSFALLFLILCHDFQ